MKKIELLLIAGILQLIGLYTIAQQPTYKNKNLSPEARAKDLFGRMNLDLQPDCN
jgi:hypothetical protein